MKPCLSLRQLLVLTVAAASVWLTACAPLVIGGAATAVVVADDRRSTGVFIDDENIETRALFRVKNRFGEQVHVNITSYNRQVLLSGEATTEAVRQGVEQEVSAVPGVKRVFNEMTVGPLASLLASSNDSRLTTIFKARFLDAKGFQANHVKVVTEAGVVYLLGMVKRSEADAATQVASTTAGVKRVVRLFEYLD